MTRHDSQNEHPVHVPPERLSPEALNGLIEEFVTRSGTDYGKHEASLAQKCSAIRKQLASGHSVIICDPISQTCNIVLSEDIQQAAAQQPGKGTT